MTYSCLQLKKMRKLLGKNMKQDKNYHKKQQNYETATKKM